jgi:hypothetical protein
MAKKHLSPGTGSAFPEFFQHEKGIFATLRMPQFHFVVGTTPLEPVLRLYPFRLQTLGTSGTSVIGTIVSTCRIPGLK